jgi:hypothetical protein
MSKNLSCAIAEPATEMTARAARAKKAMRREMRDD